MTQQQTTAASPQKPPPLYARPFNHPETDGFKIPEGVDINLPNCGIVVVAIAARRTYQEVFEYMANHHRSNWKGRTTFQERLRALEHFGVKILENKISHGRPTVSLGRWSDNYAQRNVRYIVQTTGHVQLCLNGWAIDQSGFFMIDHKTWRGRKRVRSFLMLED